MKYSMRTTAIVLGKACLFFGILPLQDALLAAAPHLRPLGRGEWAAPTNSEAVAVQVLGNKAYVALRYGGMAVIDVSDPERPVRLGGCDTPGVAYSIGVAGNYAYMVDSDQGLHVIDISNPSDCVSMGAFPTGGWAEDIVVEGNYAYIGDWVLGLEVFEVSNPTNCVRVGGYRFPRPDGVVARTRALTKAGNFVYVANLGGGMDIMHVSNPTNCAWVRNYDFARRWVHDVAVAGNYAYVGYDHGLVVIDVTDPRNSVRVGGLGMGPVSGLSVTGKYLYAKSVSHFQVFDVGNPTNFVSLGTYRVSHTFRNLTASDTRIYIANGTQGLLVLCSLPNLRFVCEIQGGSLGVPFFIEAATSLREPIQWTPVLITNPPALPFDFADYDVKLSDKPRKFYRARQNGKETP
jgi:hypothetical protein